MRQLTHWRFSSVGTGTVQTFLRFLSSSVLLQGISLGCNILVLKWLKPEAVGLWQALVLVETYFMFVQGGAINGLNRELPFALGQENSRAVAALAGTAQQIALLGSAFCLAALSAVPFIAATPQVRGGLALVLIAAAAAIYRNYLGATYRATAAFNALAGIQLGEALLAVLTLPLVFFYGYWGLAGRYTLLKVAGVALNYLFRPLRNVGRFRWSALRSLLNTGIPVFIFGYLIGVSGTFPRLILLGQGGVEWVGIFAPAAAVIAAVRTVPVALARFIYPQMSFQFGKTNDPRVLWPMAWKTAVAALVVAVPVVFILILVVPNLVTEYFPDYAESTRAIRWTLVAGAFLGASVAINALNSLKAWGMMAIYVGCRLALMYVLPRFGVVKLGSLEGVALGMAAAEAILFVVGLAVIWLATNRNRSLSVGSA